MKLREYQNRKLETLFEQFEEMSNRLDEKYPERIEQRAERERQRDEEIRRAIERGIAEVEILRKASQGPCWAEYRLLLGFLQQEAAQLDPEWRAGLVRDHESGLNP